MTERNDNDRTHEDSVRDTSETIAYTVDNKVFLVTPSYRENAGDTINTILLRLMKKDSENS